MSANVEPEEVEAVLDGVVASARDAAQVASRDFRRPQRFSAASLAALEQTLQKPLATLPAVLEETCGTKLALRLASIGEVSAEGLFQADAEATTILRFQVGGQPGWLAWDAAQAVALAEALLGSSDAAQAEARPLTHLEQRLVGDPLMTLVTALCQALGLEPSAFEFAENSGGPGSWRDAPEEPDSHRLEIELDFSREEAESSTISLYLPVGSSDAHDAGTQSLELPEHLAPVVVEVAVQLAQSEITLAQLLQLEEGDVIPTDVRVDETALLLVEERPFARAHLGTHRGRFAVRIAPTPDAPEDPR